MRGLQLREFKVQSIESLESVNFIERLMELVNHYLKTLFGAWGRHEFTIDRFDYDDEAELWDVKLIRIINGRLTRYELSIDNHTGELISFGRVRR